MKYEDLHLSDKSLWSSFRTDMADEEYADAITTRGNSQLADKTLTADAINYITGNDATPSANSHNLAILQANSDPTFKADRIKVATSAPSGMTSGQVYFNVNRTV